MFLLVTVTAYPSAADARNSVDEQGPVIADALPLNDSATAQNSMPSEPVTVSEPEAGFDAGAQAGIEAGTAPVSTPEAALVPEGDPKAAMSMAPPAQTIGDTWHLTIPEHENSPVRFLAIDKASQTFFLMERRSPLRKAVELPCATGQVAGDKYREGDLRTPEGVYFIQRKLTTGLDYQLYGDIAYTLNFPNPVDRIEGKTGYGIWIHGRGGKIVPMETRGCVALNTPDLHGLSSTLGRGTPVIIAQKIAWPPDGQSHSGEANAIIAMVREWAKAWQNKSDTFFSFYAPQKYSRSGGESFEAFKANKERLFARMPWIQVVLDDITALPGPDYWVTAFDQVYRAPGITSAVRKRLYWQKDPKGVWRIVGQEYDQPPPDLEQRYMAHVTKSVSEALSLWQAAWERADLDGYAALYLPGAHQQGRNGLKAVMEHKQTLWADNPPTRVELSNRRIALHPKGIEVAFRQVYESSNGYTDTGTKTLILEPHGEQWLISAEYWRKGN
ncbi:L,D-transpeptidase family protein [Desulfocurvibacter africanus]